MQDSYYTADQLQSLPNEFEDYSHSSTIDFYDEDNSIHNGPNNGYGTNIKSEEQNGSSVACGSNIATPVTAIPRKRSSYSLDMAASSFEDHNLAFYQPLYEQSTLPLSRNQIKVKKAIHGSPENHGAASYPPQMFSPDTNGGFRAMNYQLAPSVPNLYATTEQEMEVMLRACSTSIDSKIWDITRDQSQGKRVNLQFKDPPCSTIRPKYQHRGTRGLLNLELRVVSNWANGMESVLMTGIVLPPEDGERLVKLHPDFKVYPAGKTGGKEFKIDKTFLALGSRRKLSAGESYMRVDVGIERPTKTNKRGSKLARKGQIIVCLCVLHQQGSGEWEVIDSAQIVTGIIDIVQPQGAPRIITINADRCSYAGNVTIGVTGKNLKSKTDDCSVTFIDDVKKWKGEAKLYKEQITKESLLFQVPPYPLEDYYGQGPYPAEIKVSIHVKVGKRDTKKETPFTYYSTAMPRSDESTNSFPELGNIDAILLEAADAGPDPSWLDTSLPNLQMNPYTGQVPTSNAIETLGSGYLPEDHLIVSQAREPVAHSLRGAPAVPKPEEALAFYMQENARGSGAFYGQRIN